MFFMKSFLEPLGQYSIGFWPVQCYPKSIKRIFDRICFYTKLSGASWTTLYRAFICAIFSQEYWDKITENFSYAMSSWACLTILQRFWPAQCCPKSVMTTLHRVFCYIKLSGASWETLHKVFSCAILSQEYLRQFYTWFFYTLLFAPSQI